MRRAITRDLEFEEIDSDTVRSDRGRVRRYTRRGLPASTLLAIALLGTACTPKSTSDEAPSSSTPQSESALKTTSAPAEATTDAAAIDPSPTGPVGLKAAIAAATAATQAAPNSASAWGKLGMIHQANGDHEKAADAYRRAAKIAPKEGKWPHLLAITYEARSLTEEAISAYEASLLLQPEDVAANCSLARIYQDQGEDDRARELFLIALRLREDCLAARVGLGQVAARSGADEAAKEHFLIAVKQFPKCGQAHTALAKIFSIEGNEARADLHRRWSLVSSGKLPLPNPLLDEVAEHGYNYNARLERGQAAAARGDWSGALKQFDAAVTLRSDRADTHFFRGLALLHSAGNHDDAIESFEKASRLEGQQYQKAALLRLAQVHASQSEWEKAFESIDAVLQKDPADAAAHVEKGRLYVQQRQLEAAMREFDTAASIDADNADAAVERGKLLLLATVEFPNAAAPGSRERIDAAKELFERAKNVQPDHAAAYEFLAESYMYLRQSSEFPDEKAHLLQLAIEEFTIHANLFPERKIGHEKLIRALLTARRPLPAKQVIDEALARWPDDPRFTRFLRKSDR